MTLYQEALDDFMDMIESFSLVRHCNLSEEQELSVKTKLKALRCKMCNKYKCENKVELHDTL